MMNILALDLGTKTGWALGCKKHGLGTSGVWDFTPKRIDSGGMRYIQFKAQLNEVFSLSLESGGINVVYFEEVMRHKGTVAAHVYGGLLAIMLTICEDWNIDYCGVAVGTIKKHATGKGNANKLAMIEAAIDRGWNPADDNEADAQWLLDIVLAGKV